MPRMAPSRRFLARLRLVVSRNDWVPVCSCLLILAATLPSSCPAEPPPGYYDSVDTATQATLRSSLHEIIDDHTRFPYTAASTDTWDILEQADEDPSNPANILDLYRNGSHLKFGGGTGPYNREHVWPKSYGFPDDNSTNYPYTDCHCLFLCDSSYNSSRGNKPFRYCSLMCSEKVTVLNIGQGGGSGSYPGNSNWTTGSGTSGTWETWVCRQGDVARALLYMEVRYEGGTHGVSGASEPDLILTDDELLIAGSNTGDNEAVGYMGLRSVLLDWHLTDPVDDLERDRNDVVYSYQGNRNPFIDFPEWFEVVVVEVRKSSWGALKELFR
ncbi:MAG: endonuclease [bacterium]